MMTQRIFVAVSVAAIIGNGLSGGVFFAFSSFVMPALARLPPARGVAAMQAINVAVVPSAFLAVFLLTTLLCVGLVAAPLWRGVGTATILVCLAGLVGVVGSFGVTMAFNVPLNDRLAMPTTDALVWADYLRQWTWWNSIRGIAATLSASLLLGALLLTGAQLA